jgi:3-amino-4-hydroxybenzoic acid synthase
MSRILLCGEGAIPTDLSDVDVVIIPLGSTDTVTDGTPVGRYVEVRDAETLEEACRSARTEPYTLLDFRDPTKIPLEIVLAAANSAKGKLVTVVHDPVEAGVVLGALERGSDGAMLAPSTVEDVARLRAAAEPGPVSLNLVPLTVTDVQPAGMGERACVDVCAYLRPDEGMLIGSRADGLLLCASETHPLPYMPTRPFRVNAGAVMSYTLSSTERTSYLTDLRCGQRVLVTAADGRSRQVTVGRVKIETRPLLRLTASAPDGTVATVILQDDWHVRLLGPHGRVHNSTELRPGDVILGHLPAGARHVGYQIDELCIEQ